MNEKARTFAEEFKEFISRGNVVDMAVGVIVGSAFSAIATSLVNDVVMPVIGLIIGGLDLMSMKITLVPAVGESAEVAIMYGAFLQSILSFLLVALVVFVMVKTINKFRRAKEEEAPAPEEPSDEVKLLTEIRDSLKSHNE